MTMYWWLAKAPPAERTLDYGTPVAGITAPRYDAPDAFDVTYNGPAVLTDWDGDVAPGNLDATLDQLAERTDDLEAAPPSHATLHAGGSDALYSVVEYMFVPDAAVGAVITAGNQQGGVLHSGAGAETAFRLCVDAKTAPGASGLPITVQYGDTDDLDTVASWTTIATLTVSSEKSNKQDTMTNATIPANRLLQMNVGTIVGSPADATITLKVLRPLRTAVP